jgi:hypothetical protein
VQLIEFIPDPEFLIALEPGKLGLRMFPALATWPRFQELHLELLLDYLIGNSRVRPHPANIRTTAEWKSPSRFRKHGLG